MSIKIKNKEYIINSIESIKSSKNSLIARSVLKQNSKEIMIQYSFLYPDLLSIEINNDKSVNSIKEEFIDQGEHYYGIWEYPRGGNIDNRGASAYLLGFGDLRLKGVSWCNGRAPFYMTSRKYGIYADTTGEGFFNIAVNGKTSFDFQENNLRYYVIYGENYYKILNRYNKLAGPPVMPPLWALSSSWWNEDEHDFLNAGIKNAEENVLFTADKLSSYKIHSGLIWIDRPYGSGKRGWGNMDFDDSFPNPYWMVAQLNYRGYNLALWIANRCFNKIYLEGFGE